MKVQNFLFSFLSIFFFTSALAQEDVQSFMVSVEQSLEAEKPILLVFSGSDWCKPCIQFKNEVLEDDQFESFAQENLIIHIADFPYKRKNKLSKEITRENEKLASKYNEEGIFPNVVLLNSDQEVLARFGYDKKITPSEYRDFIANTITSK